MKYIISERQYRLLSEEDKIEDPIELLKKSTDLIYDFGALSNDWNLAVRLAKGRPFIIKGDVNLRGVDVVTLGSLVGVEGYLTLRKNKTIESLGNLKFVGGDLNLGYTNIESLGNLKSVGGYLNLYNTNIESLGNLQYVGGYLNLRDTPLSKTTTKEDVRNIPNLTIQGDIYLSL